MPQDVSNLRPGYVVAGGTRDVRRMPRVSHSRYVAVPNSRPHQLSGKAQIIVLAEIDPNGSHACAGTSGPIIRADAPIMTQYFARRGPSGTEGRGRPVLLDAASCSRRGSVGIAGISCKTLFVLALASSRRSGGRRPRVVCTCSRHGAVGCTRTSGASDGVGEETNVDLDETIQRSRQTIQQMDSLLRRVGAQLEWLTQLSDGGAAGPDSLPASSGDCDGGSDASSWCEQAAPGDVLPSPETTSNLSWFGRRV